MEYEPKSGVFLHWHVDIHFYLCNRGVFYQVTDAMSILNSNLSNSKPRQTLKICRGFSLFTAELFLSVGETCGLPRANAVRPYRVLVKDFAISLLNLHALRAPTVKQFYIKAQKGRDFLVPFAHNLPCKISCVIRYFVFGRYISDVFAYAKVMLLTSFVMMLLPKVAMM